MTIDKRKYTTINDFLTDKCDNYDAIIIELPRVNLNEYKNNNYKINSSLFNKDVYEKVKSITEKGGFVFVYGLYSQLVKIDKFFGDSFTFKYMIAVEGPEFGDKKVKNTHYDILMYHKNGDKIDIDTKNNRNSYIQCAHCGRNVKDWGGKKHLMNKDGSAISDVWRNFKSVKNRTVENEIELLNLNKVFLYDNLSTMPFVVKEKIYKLLDTKTREKKVLEVDFDFAEKLSLVEENKRNIRNISIENSIVLGDSIKEMKKLISKYPDGCFNYIFADPPYNLDKEYDNYSDNIKSIKYIEWCNEWLNLCSELLLPGGSMFVLNIPKWALKHAEFLEDKLFLYNWIVWDEMSIPMGKIMPAHYSMLHFTKGIPVTMNEGGETYPINYCSRISCKKTRTDNDKIKRNDIWSDISRNKHSKNRNFHPCQLPEKLMKETILMTTNEKDICFDPFAGAGTTAMVAKKLKRNYYTIDISEEYVNIAKENVENGKIVNHKENTSNKLKITKKEVELFVQNIAERNGYIDEELFVSEVNKNKTENFNIENILILYKNNIKKPIKAARVFLQNKKMNK